MGKKKFSWGSIKAKGKSWLNKAKKKGKSWLTKGKSWLNKAKKGSGKSLYGKRRGSGSGSGGSGFKKRKGGIAWTIPSSSGSGSGGSGVGGVIKKRKGGVAWTIPKDDEEEELDFGGARSRIRSSSRKLYGKRRGSGSGSGKK